MQPGAFSRCLRVGLAFTAALAVAACGELGGEGGGSASAPQFACPDAVPGRDVLAHSFVGSGPLDAKIRTYVQASNDLGNIANAVELEVAQACFRIGTDLGVPASAMNPRQESGGRATGACFAAAGAVDAVMRSGGTVQVRVTPPFCSPNGIAQNQCMQACGVNPNDAECGASCRARGDVYSTCTPVLVVVTPTSPNAAALRLAATLQTNLPGLLHAELAHGRRLGNAVQLLGQIGNNLPGMVSQAGGGAVGCAKAAHAEVNTASWQMQASVRASSQITNRVGATHG